MFQKPPPIQWLPVFEAAARHLNFKQAAEELCVSPPAVSQQIKTLEDYLGTPLFDRSTKKLRLTPAGQYYFSLAQKLVQQHNKGYREFERRFRFPTLQLSAPIFISQELLIPNYNTFSDYAPGTELRLSTGNHYIDFENEPLDAALRFGTGDWPDLDCRFVCDVEPKLVCSQAYLEKHNLSIETFMDEEEMERHVLLSVFDNFGDWKSFFRELEPKNKIVLDSYFSVVRSAEAGLGIAVGLLPVVNRLIEEERLIVLNSVKISTDYSYWLVAPHNRASTEHIDALYRWIKDLFDTL